MKNLIIIVGTIILGAIIFTMMVGNDENSLKSATKDSMIKSTLVYQNE